MLSPVIDVQLRRVADFDVANALGEIVLGQFEGDALQTLGGLHHGAGVGESLQVLGQVGVLVLNTRRRNPSSVWDGNLTRWLFASSISVGIRSETVEVQMQVRSWGCGEETPWVWSCSLGSLASGRTNHCGDVTFRCKKHQAKQASVVAILFNGSLFGDRAKRSF